jgi:hypothetical protein
VAESSWSLSMRSRTTSTSKKNSLSRYRRVFWHRHRLLKFFREEYHCLLATRQRLTSAHSLKQPEASSSMRAERRRRRSLQIVGYQRYCSEQANVPKEQQPMPVRPPLKQNLLDRVSLELSRPPEVIRRPVTQHSSPHSSVSPTYNQPLRLTVALLIILIPAARPYVAGLGLEEISTGHESSTCVSVSSVPEILIIECL